MSEIIISYPNREPHNTEPIKLKSHDWSNATTSKEKLRIYNWKAVTKKSQETNHHGKFIIGETEIR